MTKYSIIFDEFKDKITDYDLPIYTIEIQEDILKSLLRKSIGRFKRICNNSLLLNDDKNSIESDLTYEELDILTEWMVHFWITPFRNNSENMRPFLNTKDFSQISPANLLNAVNLVYESSYKRANSLANKYSYLKKDGGFRKLKPQR